MMTSVRIEIGKRNLTVPAEEIDPEIRLQELLNATKSSTTRPEAADESNPLRERTIEQSLSVAPAMVALQASDVMLPETADGSDPLRERIIEHSVSGRGIQI
jgi:hypothetical protein